MHADLARVQVDLSELLDHLIEQTGPGKPVDLGVKFEMFEDVAHLGRKALHIAAQLMAMLSLIPQQGFQGQAVGVVEGGAGFLSQERVWRHALRFSQREFGQHGILGRGQDTVDAAQHCEGEDDLAIIRLLVVAAQRRSATDHRKAERAC